MALRQTWVNILYVRTYDVFSNKNFVLKLVQVLLKAQGLF